MHPKSLAQEALKSRFWRRSKSKGFSIESLMQIETFRPPSGPGPIRGVFGASQIRRSRRATTTDRGGSPRQDDRARQRDDDDVDDDDRCEKKSSCRRRRRSRSRRGRRRSIHENESASTATTTKSITTRRVRGERRTARSHSKRIRVIDDDNPSRSRRRRPLRRHDPKHNVKNSIGTAAAARTRIHGDSKNSNPTFGHLKSEQF